MCVLLEVRGKGIQRLVQNNANIIVLLALIIGARKKERDLIAWSRSDVEQSWLYVGDGAHHPSKASAQQVAEG